MSKQTQHVTINQLSEEFGSDRRTVKKWLAQEGIVAGKDGYSAEQARACIRRFKERLEAREPDIEGSGDAAEKIRQEVIKLKRENRIQERLEAETYVEREEVEKLILMAVSKLENIPSKIESEFGDPRIKKRLEQLLDEVRSAIGKGVMTLDEMKQRTQNDSQSPPVGTNGDR